MLALLIRSIRAKRVLEIGTLGGYSTIWMARALTERGSRLISLESEAKHAAIAKENIARAGVGDCVDVVVGKAQTARRAGRL